MIHFFFIFIFFSLSSIIAREVQFIPYIGNEQVTIGKQCVIGQDTLSITSLKYYLSFIHTKQDSSIHHVTYLLDMQDSLSCTFPDDVTTFMFGMDSSMNVNTSFTHSLDPIHGMFWTWNSGYVNCKIEGISNRSRQLHQSFTIHIGGFRFPYATAFMVDLPQAPIVRIAIDLLPAFRHAMNKYAGNIMSPGEAAFECSRILMNSMRIQQ